jgi:hypothetical protein
MSQSNGKVFKRLETKLIHAGEPIPRIQGAVSMPITWAARWIRTPRTFFIAA